ncbi:DNA helicase UvrD [Candidatus Woesearchaeota archaeon]|nr:DNA helicase UvrD [Candidatus Woesearchaeota archaeon]
MPLIADLHVHGAYAGACSKDLSIANLSKWAKVKGIDVLGTGDFTHPKWFEHLSQELKEDEQGVLHSSTGQKFMWTTEISLIYSQDGKGRRVHLVMLAPNKEVVKQITDQLLKWGRVDYDGRPIFGKSCIEFTETMMNISKDIELIPAHAWTPWFSLFGSNSGFDSLKDCFAEKSKYIHAIETGLSSDPPMNRRLSQLDNINLVSFSDLHSYWPWRIGREATLFDVDLTYKNVIEAIRTGKGLHSTLEVDPPYGKYHIDGHRNCKFSCDASQTKKLNGICPVCKKPLTIGVAYRVEELADRPAGFVKKNAKPFIKLMPLHEILSFMMQKNLATKAVWAEYNKIMAGGKNEFDILLHTSKQQLETLTHPKIVEAILENRDGKIVITEAGYDGEYGKPSFGVEPIAEKQRKLFE